MKNACDEIGGWGIFAIVVILVLVVFLVMAGSNCNRLPVDKQHEFVVTDTVDFDWTYSIDTIDTDNWYIPDSLVIGFGIDYYPNTIQFGDGESIMLITWDNDTLDISIEGLRTKVADSFVVWLNLYLGRNYELVRRE